ncbi:MAG: thiamine diphosphokinase [Lachnospiraceae bacterium]|nr:thiamine diphosphokinase [Lachnospiraceae bacterium]
MGKCIIMCAGEFNPVDLDREEGDFVIAADNGLTYLQRMGIVPDHIIGDYDSLVPEGQAALREFEKERPEAVTRLPKEKDDTDTMAAVRLGFERGYKKFFIYAALGGRLDHTIANLQTLCFIKEHGGQGYIMDASCMAFIIRNETREFAEGFRGTFSLFSMDDKCTGVTIKGMDYETDGITLTNSFPIGESNFIPGDRKASVTVEHGTALAIVTWA